MELQIGEFRQDDLRGGVYSATVDEMAAKGDAVVIRDDKCKWPNIAEVTVRIAYSIEI